MKTGMKAENERVKVEGDLVKENAPQSPTSFSHFTCLLFSLHLVSALKRQGTRQLER